MGIKIGMGFVISALIAALIFSVRGCMDAKKQLTGMKSTYAEIQDRAKFYRDQYNQVHAYTESLELQRDQAQVFFSNQIDSMASLLDIKPKQVKSIVYVPFQADINIDSLREALARVDTLVRRDTVHGRAKVNSQMAFTTYDKRTGFLGLGKKSYLDVHFDNPMFRPLNMSGFDITPPARHWSVGPYAGYGWNGKRWSPQVGISIQYSLIKF